MRSVRVGLLAVILVGSLLAGRSDGDETPGRVNPEDLMGLSGGPKAKQKAIKLVNQRYAGRTVEVTVVAEVTGKDPETGKFTLFAPLGAGARVHVLSDQKTDDLRGQKVVVLGKARLRGTDFWIDATSIRSLTQKDPAAETEVPESPVLGLKGRVRLKGPYQSVTGAAWTRDGKTLAVSTGGRAVWLWDMATGKQTGVLGNPESDPEVVCIALSPDSKVLAAGRADRTVVLWNLEQRKLAATLPGHTMNLAALAFSRDGKTLTSLTELTDLPRKPAEPARKGFELKQWDVAGGKERAGILLDGTTVRLGNPAFVKMVLSPDGANLALAGSDSEIVIQGTRKTAKPFTYVTVWDVAAREGRWEDRFTDGGAAALAWDGDGKTLIVAGSFPPRPGVVPVSLAKVLDPSSGKERAFPINGSPLVATTSADGKTLALWDLRIVVLFDLVSGKEIVTLPEHGGPIALSPDGTILVTGVRSKEVHLVGNLNVWSVERESGAAAGQEARERATIREPAAKVSSLAFAPDGKVLFAAYETIAPGNHPGQVKAWDVAAAKEGKVFRSGGSSALQVAVAPDGKLLATVENSPIGGGTTVYQVQLWDAATCKVVGAAQDKTMCVAFSPDSKTLATGHVDGKVRLRPLDKSKEPAPIAAHTYGVRFLTFSSDGKTLATGSWVAKDSAVKLWDVAAGKEKAALQQQVLASAPLAAVFTPDGKTLAVAREGTVELWDVAAAKVRSSLPADFGMQASLAFSPDGQTLATAGSPDGAVRLWDMATGKQKAVLRGQAGAVSAVAFSPDGRVLAAGAGDLKLWDLPEGGKKDR